jgi:hypothetical protein
MDKKNRAKEQGGAWILRAVEAWEVEGVASHAL